MNMKRPFPLFFVPAVGAWLFPLVLLLMTLHLHAQEENAEDSKGIPIRAIPTVLDAPIYSAPEGVATKGKISDAYLFKSLLVGKKGYAGEESTAKPEDRVQLLDTSSGAEIGYLEVANLIFNRTVCLRVLRDDGKPSNIHRKALVVTDYRKMTPEDQKRDEEEGRVVQGNSGEKVVRVAARKKPVVSAEANENIDYYQPFYVWQVRKEAGGDWYLLGKELQITRPQQAVQALCGWVEKRRLYDWSTRQAIEYDWETRDARRKMALKNPQEAGAVVFENKADAEEFARLGSYQVTAAMRDEAQEDIYAAGRFSQELSRYPLIASFPMGGRKSRKEIQSLYQIGWIGGVISDKGLDATRIEIEIQRARQRDAGLGSLQLDVVILMDGTKSMDPFRQDALRTAMDIVDSVKSKAPPQTTIPYREDELVTRYSICIYRNANDSAAGLLKRFEHHSFKDLGSKGAINDIRSIVTEIKFDSSEREIREEALFAGIKRAVEDCAAEQTANPFAYKLMIVIGDSGDKSNGVDVEDAAAALNKHGYDFFAVSVVPERKRGEHADFGKFITDMGKLAGKVKSVQVDNDSDGSPVSGRVLFPTQESSISPLIQASYEKGLAARNTKIEIIQNPSSDAYPTRLRNHVIEELKKKGVDLTKLKTGGIQMFGEGWTTSLNKDRLSQWRLCEYTRKSDLNTYLELLKMFTPYSEGGFAAQSMARKMNQDEIDDIINAIVKTFKLKAGQLTEDKIFIGELLGNASSDLPVRSKMLSMSLFQLREWLNDENKVDERARELARIGLCYEILFGYYNDEQIEFVRNESGNMERIERSSKDGLKNKVKLWVRKGLDYYSWIPDEYFP